MWKTENIFGGQREMAGRCNNRTGNREAEKAENNRKQGNREYRKPAVKWLIMGLNLSVPRSSRHFYCLLRNLQDTERQAVK